MTIRSLAEPAINFADRHNIQTVANQGSNQHRQRGGKTLGARSTKWTALKKDRHLGDLRPVLGPMVAIATALIAIVVLATRVAAPAPNPLTRLAVADGIEEESLETLNQNRPDPCDPPALPEPVSRRVFVGSLAAAGAFASMLRSTAEAIGNVNATATGVRKGESQNPNGDIRMTDAIIEEKIRRARLSGPSIVTANATVAEMDAQGHLQVLSKGTNEWVCCPGNENIIGDVPMALDPMGMQWFTDLVAHKPKPTNTAPGLIYMLCGAYQHSYTDPFDRTSPPIPIGPHWMLLWPFDAKAAGLGTVMRDAGTMVMFAGTPYAHLHICGSPWDGNEYRPGDRVIRTLTYARP